MHLMVCFKAASPNYLGYTQAWSAPTLHSSTQLQPYAVQYPGGRACGYGVRHDAPYPVPFASTIASFFLPQIIHQD